MCKRFILLEQGKMYRVHGYEARGQVLECLRSFIDADEEEYCARVRSSVTGWTMTIHGVIVYSDGSIGWEFSTDSYVTIK